MTKKRNDWGLVNALREMAQSSPQHQLLNHAADRLEFFIKNSDSTMKMGVSISRHKENDDEHYADG